MRTLVLTNADFRILMAGMTFFALLVVLLTKDGSIGPSFIGADWIQAPLHE